MLVLPGAIIGLIVLHILLVIRLGVVSPPWSKEAAGLGPLDGTGAPSANGGSAAAAPATNGGADGR